MSAYRARGRTIRTVKVPTMGRDGKLVWVKRTTGTRDPTTAKQMTAMLVKLGPSGLRAWDVLDRVHGNALSVPALWDRWLSAGEDVTRLRAALNDVDLLTKRAAWRANVLKGAGENTANYYARALKSLVQAIGVGGTLHRSRVTTEALTTWLNGLTMKNGQALADGTKRKYHAGVSSFFGYCVTVAHVLERNPMLDVDPPVAVDPRDRHLTAEQAQRLADVQASPYRELSALLTGTGIEVGVALKLTVRDVDVAAQEITARGGKQRKGKTHRNRVTSVAGWAWPYVLKAIAGKLPDALLFDTIPRMLEARQSHQAACRALGITNYTMRDARHTFGVRMIRAGTPSQQVAKLMGHVNAAMIHKVYGIYEPTQAERQHWERIAAARDADTTSDTPSDKASEQ